MEWLWQARALDVVSEVRAGACFASSSGAAGAAMLERTGIKSPRKSRETISFDPSLASGPPSLALSVLETRGLTELARAFADGSGASQA